MELEVNVIELEDGIEYIIVDAIRNNEDKYLFLANKNDETDVCIRKIVAEDGIEYIEKLEDEDELEAVLTVFNKKMKEKEGKNEK